ncbi:phosphotransferase enzyme family protein [Aspergillus eucalypticola CBS 122712]|uniref:Phosphotransferase enzyme family protein n=1 Tax=Aspergillus eucalypticola (strain CBS 122712 / IBT 29274) TaxID=1448314 RepID=A0A317W3I4_ASPEC|nr:phosphotransferase enzyme family protein [Aspergillus eucalypticola CBS 122712]PWY79817.1 phosphotransferase enzyme family protein [Aspergillus eucalypticola CBS 122712]
MSDKDLLNIVSQELAGTQYASSSLTPLSGGTANFVYRAQLNQPLQDGTISVIVKHTEAFIALNREFKLPAERCLFEESILKALDGLPSKQSSSNNTDAQTQEVTVKTPRLFSFNRQTNTAVIEDLPDSLDLKSFLISTAASNNVTQEWASSIGRALGNWLRSFHHWAENEAQSGIAAEMDKNQYMRDLKFMVNYDALVNTIDKYPTILGDSRDVFSNVREMAAAELSRKNGNGFGIIHGDFCVLIPKTALEQQSHLPLFIIDWELCHCGARALDLGQMFAELYLLKHFKDIDAATWIIQGFMKGYQELDDETAFRVLIHVGVHFIAWAPLIPGWGTSQQIEDAVRLGRDIVTKAWEKDRSWFEGVWKSLFRDR